MAALILIATAIRIPFLIHNFGLLDADDANAVLVAKHIAEGNVPPVYHYGQFYLGTFNYHLYALVFKFFGFSILGVLITSVLVYLAFIILQFFFFKEVFSSFYLSFVLSLFYCLPLGHLLAVSFELGISFPMVLLIGSFCMDLAYLIYAKAKEKFIPLLGFCSGFLFWLHPSSAFFIISSFVIVALRFRLKLRKYFILIFHGFIGAFPMIIAEIGYKFETFKYLFSQKKASFMMWDKIKATIDNIIFLVSSEKNFLNIIYFLCIILGIAAIIFLNFKKRKFVPQNIFLIFFFVFVGIYFYSKYSQIYITQMRYLYPLYYVLPVFLVLSFDFFRSKMKYGFMVSLFLIMVLFSNLKVIYKDYNLVKGAHGHLKRIIGAMEKTEKIYWASEFWQANLLTALSGERIRGWSYPHEDYFPYALEYFNQGDNNNYVFFYEPGSFAVKFKEMYQHISGNLKRSFDQSEKFIELLDRLGIKAEKEKIDGNCCLIYDISSPAMPLVLGVPIPEKIPEPVLSKIECSEGFLNIGIKNHHISEERGFRLHMEIPNYSSVLRGYPLDREEVKCRIPFPLKKSFKIRYYLDYMGLKIPSTVRETVYSPPDQDLKARRKQIVYLSGFSHLRKIFGKRRRICEKEVDFEINRLLSNDSRVRLYLFSPFSFNHPFWYGDYFQEVRIEINGHHLTERRLKDGENVIEFGLEVARLQEDRNFIKLRFKYHLPFKFDRLWKTAALLNRIEIK